MPAQSFPSLISIVGLTATGKTALALQLAELVIKKQWFAGVDLISVDSRQVYRGLEIISGADIPAGFNRPRDYLAAGRFPHRAFSRLVDRPFSSIGDGGVNQCARHQTPAHFSWWEWLVL